MEKTKHRKKSARIGLMLFFVWFVVASFVIFTLAAINGEGKTSDGKFEWTWTTNNTNNGAAGTLEGTSSGNTLTLKISATTSTHVDEKKDGCGNVTQVEQAAASTINTATITNKTGSAIQIKSVKETTASCSISELAILAPGDKFTISITAEPASPTASTTQSKSGSVVIQYAEAQNVSLTYYGVDGVSYSYGATVLDGSTDMTTEEIVVGSNITLPAAPTVTNGIFYGWRLSHDGSLHGAEDTVVINNNTSVYPVITATDAVAPFTVGGTQYQFWTDAAKAAGSSGTVILNQNYTLSTTMAANGVSPDGSPYMTGTDGNVNFIVPNGVTLVIPYSDTATSNSDPLTDPDRIAEKNAFVNATAFRTLTIPADATINCAGNIRVDGRQYSASTQYTGHVYGAYGKIDLAGTINMASGSSLRAYGYITGTGTVNASSTAAVYELFQMADWRGGNNTSALYGGMKGDSFLISSFYVQNIEANLVMNAGATLTAYVTIAAGLIGDKSPYNSTAKLIASDGLFQLGSGAKLTRTYTGGRMTYKVEGNSSFGSITLNLHTGIGSFNMNSSEYILNLPSSMTVQVASGTTTLPVKAKLLPGAVIQIDSGATVKLTGSSELVIYDRDDWTSGNYTYAGNFNAVKYSVKTKMSSLPNSPGQLIVNGTLEVNDTAAVYSTTETNATNGNAGLSGNGKIVINGAPETLRTVVTEIAGSSQTKDTTEIVPLQAKVKGVSTTPVTSLSVGKTYFGVGDNYWCAHDIIADTGTCACGAQFAAYVVGKKAYSSVDDALGESVRGDTVKIYVSGCTLSGTDANPFDLNGRKIEGTVAVSGTIIDSATNGYNSSDAGYIKTATGTVDTLHNPTGGAQAGKYYIKVPVDGTTQFHRVAVSVTGIQVYKSEESYNAIFRGHYKGTGLVPSAVGFGFTNTDKSVTSVSNPTDKNSLLSNAFEFFYGKDAVQSVSKVNATATVSGQTITSIDRDVAALLKTFPKE